jgi:hypothetical protein
MEEKITALCESFIENQMALKKVFTMESAYIYPIAANALTASGFRADEEKLRECKSIISKNAGLFSFLNGMVATPFAVNLSMKDDPKAAFDRAAGFYAVIKKSFGSSSYSALLAFLLPDMIGEEQLESVVARSRELFQQMKKKHPFLTGEEDSVLAAFLALSEKDNATLIDDMEACYTLLKGKFSSQNSIQSVSHILSITGGSVREKVEHLTGLYDTLKDAGRKYNVYTLATLAAVSILDTDNEKLRDTILTIDDYLSGQKGYGFFGIDKGTRLMHAAMLTADLYDAAQTTHTAATASTLAMIAAQQAAICIIIASAALANVD